MLDRGPKSNTNHPKRSFKSSNHQISSRMEPDSDTESNPGSDLDLPPLSPIDTKHWDGVKEVFGREESGVSRVFRAISLDYSEPNNNLLSLDQAPVYSPTVYSPTVYSPTTVSPIKLDVDEDTEFWEALQSSSSSQLSCDPQPSSPRKSCCNCWYSLFSFVAKKICPLSSPAPVSTQQPNEKYGSFSTS